MKGITYPGYFIWKNVKANSEKQKKGIEEITHRRKRINLTPVNPASHNQANPSFASKTREKTSSEIKGLDHWCIVSWKRIIKVTIDPNWNVLDTRNNTEETV